MLHASRLDYGMLRTEMSLVTCTMLSWWHELTLVTDQDKGWH